MKKWMLLSLALMCMLSARAQRLIPSQKGMEVAISAPIIKGERMFSSGQFGVSVSLTKYMKRAGYGFLSLDYERQNIPYRTYRIGISDALLHVGYMEPVLSDRRKNVMLYAGISALGGYEQVNEDRRLLPDGATLLDNSKWVYGGALHTSLECFLSDHLLLLLKLRTNLLFGSDLHLLRPAIAAGVRFNF